MITVKVLRGAVSAPDNFGFLLGTLSGQAVSITDPMPATGSVAVAVGDLVYVVVAEQTSITTTAVTDNLGNTYATVETGTDAGPFTAVAYYSRVSNAGTLTQIDADTTASANNVVILAQVLAGPFDATPLDKHPSNITSDVTSPLTCPATGTLTQADEVVLCFCVANGTVTLTATSPNLRSVTLATGTIHNVALGYQTVAATTDISPEWTRTSDPTTCILGTASFMKA